MSRSRSPMRWLAGVTLAVAAQAASAWSGVGHETVAELAERQLRPETRAAALALLEGEGHTRLADIARWADEIRDRPEYAWSGKLHYVNFEREDCRYDPPRHCRNGECVIDAATRFRNEVADASLPLERRREALKFLVHVIGDLHQPLHAGHGHDKGGNTFQLNIDGKGSNLHRVWDYELLASSARSTAELADKLSASPLPAATGGFAPLAWAQESCRIVMQDGFYPRRGRLSPTYIETWRPTAEQRVRLAAARLAAALEDALGER